MLEPDGTIRIAWLADGYAAIHVRARFRRRDELEAYARGVADLALLERSLSSLVSALRRAYPGCFDLITSTPQGRPWHVTVSFHPPPGEPNPDPV